MKIKAISELADLEFLGNIGRKLINVLPSQDVNELNNVKELLHSNQIDNYQFVQYLCIKCQIQSGINFDSAKNGNEFELAKITCIFLINGIAYDQREICEASELLDTKNYTRIQILYDILETKKLKFPPNDISYYEEFLCHGNTNDDVDGDSLKVKQEVNNLSMNTQSNDIVTTPVKHTKRALYESDCMSNIDYLLSPMKKASIEIKKSDETKDNIDDLYNEKWKLERDCHQKELFIFELQDQIKERDDSIRVLENEFKNIQKKLKEQNELKDRAAAFESMATELETMRKEYVRQVLFYELNH
jgi:hypothetical protein